MVNFGSLATEIGLVVWGTPANFNGFRVLAVLLHGTLIVGVSQTLRHWAQGACHLHSAGRPSSWALAHILVLNIVTNSSTSHYRTQWPPINVIFNVTHTDIRQSKGYLQCGQSQW